MKREFGDAVIIGASSLDHINQVHIYTPMLLLIVQFDVVLMNLLRCNQNLVDLEKGPLPEDVLHVLDDAWLSVKAYSTNYWH